MGRFGGGLAADNGRIYAATGYGHVVALDAKERQAVIGRRTSNRR